MWMVALFLLIGQATGRDGLTLAREIPARLDALSPSQEITTTHTLYLPGIARPAPQILIAAAHIDSAMSGERDEAILIWNNGAQAENLAGWQIVGNRRAATVPPDLALWIPPGAGIWCARDGAAFAQSFGFLPSCEWDGSHEAVPDLTGSVPLFTNAGGVILLRRPDGQTGDVLLYGTARDATPGWEGPAAQLYARGALPSEGQVWRRKVDPATGRVVDTDRAGDWSGDLADLAWGRQIFLPGWTVWRQTVRPPQLSPAVDAAVRVVISPDALYPSLLAQIQGASQRMDLSLYTLEHPELFQALAQAAQRGVAIRLLMDGSPAGGISPVQRWGLSQLVAAGVDVRLLRLRGDAPNGLRSRYRFFHAKYGIIDGQRAFVGTENWSYNTAPLTPPGQTAPGRRGVYLFTDAPPVIGDLQALFDQDWQPETFWDLAPFQPETDGPPPEFVLPEAPVADRAAAFAQPMHAHTTARFAISTAPEQESRPDALLRQLLAQAGPGDLIHTMQLYEHKFWGASHSNPIADPNPRLEALIQAARRGATVYVLLDGYFDDTDALRNNRATVAYLQTLAQAEGLAIHARTGNPTGLGIHAKLMLMQINGVPWSVVGSLNGSEISHKINREVTLTTDSAEVYGYLLGVFEHDFGEE
jgi:phosphatidylserine/phosphatidylglycerophosphate/cardiolipin synthase-like enzyme